MHSVCLPTTNAGDFSAMHNSRPIPRPCFIIHATVIRSYENGNYWQQKVVQLHLIPPQEEESFGRSNIRDATSNAIQVVNVRQ
jgi:hypothetical protein